MKKFFTVLLWIGLAVSLVTLVSVAGERTALRDQAQKEKQKYDALKTMYDQEKAEWQIASDELTADKAALILEKQALSAALNEINQEMDSVTAEKNAASDRLSQIMAVLTPEAETPEASEEEKQELSTHSVPPAITRLHPELVPLLN